MFDPYSPNLKFLGDSISSVSIQGAFNNYGADHLTGPDANGIYKIKEILPLNQKIGYQFIVNSASASTAYITDPDNPHLGNDFNPYVIKQINNIPEIEPKLPVQGAILSYPAGTINIEADITLNDSNTVIDENSIHVFVDGNQVTSVFDSTKDGYMIKASVANLSIGRHIVRFAGADIHGNTAKDAFLTFGVYNANSGYHYVDEENDDNGPGNYIYSSIVSSHAGDIHDININTNTAGDSLLFTVDMGAIDDYTRIALEITNEIDRNYVEALPNADIKVSEWNNKGIYLIIAAPNSSQPSGNENKLYISRSPLKEGITVKINSDAKTTGQFKFALPLNYLENIMGSFTDKWYFGAFSYFGSSSGIIKVDGKLGGSSLPGNPSVYDVAFSGNTDIQQRLLSNFILQYFVGGPKEAVIGTEYRGAAGITAAQINSSLANRPVVKLLTGGGDWYEDTVRVYGTVNDISITNATFNVGNMGVSSDTTVSVTNGMFEALLHLSEGINIVKVGVVKNSDSTFGKAVSFNYRRDNKTNIVIKYSINQNNVTLDASSSINPDQLSLTFEWKADASNPAAVTLSGANTDVASFTAPAVDGEYYFTVTATTSKDTSWARAVIVVDSGTAHTVDMTKWHPSWVDKAVVYEIYPRSFSFFGNFNAIVQALQRLKNLGITCIWLMPIMPAASPHGYNITDYYDVNPEYGTKQDFSNFVKAAHQNGIKVLMDLVINHTSAVHPFMKDAFQYKKYSPYYNFYEWDSKGNYKYLFNWWDLPNINYEEKWVRDYMIRMIDYWVDNFNIDGYRCDVAWGVNDTRPSGPAFWQRFRNNLKGIKPDLFLLAEAQSDQLRYFDDKFDSGYDWPFFNMLKGVMSHNSSITSLDSLLEWYQSPNYLPYVKPFRFLENHDEARFISVYSVEQTKLGAAILFTLPGVPLIYAGQETGETSQRNMIGWNDAYGLQVYYQSLVKIRESNPALEQGEYVGVNNTSPDSVYSYIRMEDNNKAIIINNFYGNNVHVTVNVPVDTLNLDPNKTWYANDLLNKTSEQVSNVSLSNLTVDLFAYQSKIIVLDNSPLTGVKESVQHPLTYNLLQNYPNPFNPSTTITYEIPNTEKVNLVIYDILGRKIKTLVNNVQTAGRYKVVWNGKNNFNQQVASGIYFYRMQGGNFATVKKMILLK